MRYMMLIYSEDVPMDQVSFSFRGIDVQAVDRKGRFEQVSCDFSGIKDGNVIGHNHDAGR